MGLKDFIINKKIKRNKRNVKFHNLNTAKNIAVLYCIKNKTDYEKVKKFISYLKEKKINVSALGFVFKPDEIGNIYLGQSGNHFFSEKHINKLGKIKEECIT
ncbi:MAG: hypothetical protein GXO50_05860, partial [Chlorobi bacterium]|nr:hypothetical protein [Chlorobiota bacterium]